MSSDQSITFQTIYKDHHSWLNSWLRKKMGCPIDAADLMQDTFVKLFLMSDFSNLNEPRAYLTTSAKHLLIDRARRQKIENAYIQAVYQLQHQDVYPSPEESQYVTECLFAISKMMDGLPSIVVKVFLLNRLDELSHLEIANELNISTNVVKHHLAKAMLCCYKAIHGTPTKL